MQVVPLGLIRTIEACGRVNDVVTHERYWLRVDCSGGVLFERYVTAADAEVDLITGALARLGEGEG